MSAAGLLFTSYGWAEPAQDFTLPDSAGNEVSLSDYQGRPLVLHFWASWCPYCKNLQPGLERLSRKYAPQGLVVLGINFREDEGVEPQAVLAARNITFKTLVEGDTAARDYTVRGTPSTFFINRAGEVVKMTNTSDPDDPELDSLASDISAQ